MNKLQILLKITGSIMALAGSWGCGMWLAARRRQQMRCRGAAMRENGRLSPGEILKYCPLGLEEQEFLEQASEQAGLSMRGCHRVIRVARTIADLEGKDRIGVEHLGQALFFRNQNVLRE